ncbi:MAG TPA: hypothetical protein VHC45_15605 [Gaiellaceae bacterium]|nr:hypothetical protein [Gaiellaceae bacterium]
MAHTRAGLLFGLPHPVETATLLAGAESWREPLEEAGVRIVPATTELVVSEPVQLVVAPAGLAWAATALDPGAIVLVGRGGRRALRRAGYRARRFLPLPSLGRPSLLVPVDRPRVARYALANLSVPAGFVKTLRNVLAGLAVAARLPLPGTVVLASRSAEGPSTLRPAAGLGLPAEVDWLLVLGRAVERSAFFLFPRGARKPSWVLKFSPEDRGDDPFLGDERGARLVRDVGGALAEHAPRLVGVSTTGERPVTVETAAVGAPLVYRLRAPGRRAAKRALVADVGRWLVDVAAATALPGRAEEALAALDFPEGIVEETGADVAALCHGLGGLPAVLEHRDLAPTHVLVTRDSFSVIDWEEAARVGLPLADLAFFLAQVLPILDGELDDPRIGRHEAFARLFRGESPSAGLLFELLDEACRRLEVPPDAVPALLSLTWLRLSAGPRRHLAEAWFGDPELGPSWPAWTRRLPDDAAVAPPAAAAA